MDVVEIGANKQSCDPSVAVLLKLVAEVVLSTREAVRVLQAHD
jgi:hypothetical protein